MAHSHEQAVAGQYGAIDVPPQLRASVARHQAHLASLVNSLRSAGLDQATIDLSVQQIVRSYEAELIAAMRELMKANDNG